MVLLHIRQHFHLHWSLISVSCLEEFEFQTTALGDSSRLDRVINAVASNCNLKRVGIQLGSFGQLESICRSIERPDCKLEELKVGSYHRSLSKQVRLMLIESLRKNSSLTTLRLYELHDMGENSDIRIDQSECLRKL
jgi:hypothetical protein